MTIDEEIRKEIDIIGYLIENITYFVVNLDYLNESGNSRDLEVSLNRD